MKCLVKFRILFLYLIITLVNTNANERSLSVVDQNANNEENDVSIDDEPTDDNEEIKPFIATKEWQTISKGQIIPAGLHIRINLETGLKEAKILDKNNEEIDKNTEFIDKHKKVSETQNGFNSKTNRIRDQIKSVLNDMKFSQRLDLNEMKDSVKTSGFRSIDKIKKDFDEMNIKILSETEVLKSLIQKYKKSSISEKLDLLPDIEYLVHSIDIAQDFVKMNGLNLLLPDLNSTDSELRAQIAFTIGSAMNANPKVQIEVLKSGALKEFLLLLRYDTSNNVKKRALFAISSLVRQFPSAQKSLIQEYGGLSIFADLFKHSDITSIKLSAKVITLLNDLLIERQLTSKYATNDKLSQIKLKQYQQIGLNEAIIETGFCQLVTNLLNIPDNDIREKTIEAMNSLSSLCKHEFQKTLPILQQISNDFNDLSKIEINNDSNDIYFTNLYKLVSKLISDLKSELKDEF